MSIARRLATALTTLTIVISGAVIVAPTATAAPTSYTVVHGTKGVGGSIAIARHGGATLSLAEGRQATGPKARSNSQTLQYLRAGGGWCVWEERYDERGVRLGDRTFGQGSASRTYELEGYYSAATAKSILNVFPCS